MLKIMFAAPDITGSSYYRMYQPAKYLNDHKLHMTAFKVTPLLEELEDSEADVVVLHRSRSSNVLDSVKKMQSSGKIVIYDIDDDMFNIDENNIDAQKDWSEDAQQDAIWLMKACNAITVSTQQLWQDLYDINNNIHIIPNYIGDFKIPERVDRSGAIRIGWAGSSSHESDFTPEIVAPLLEIKSRYNVELIMCGHVPSKLVGKVRYIAGFDPRVYLKHFSELQFDIGIIPCKDTIFNMSKSNLKFLEYGVFGIPSVISDILPYNDIPDRCCIKVKNTSTDWYNALKSLVEHVQLRNTIGHNAGKYVRKKYLIKNNIDKIADLYSRIWRQECQLTSI